MTDIESGTEDRIISAARNVFIRKGYYGTRMQEIADEAGINKALLHYYFRNKDRLFEMIFLQAFTKFVPVITGIISGSDPWEKKIDDFVANYMLLLRSNPYLPQFILNEINRDPEALTRLFHSAGLDANHFIGQIQLQLVKQLPQGLDVRHFLINLLSMCIFPVAARPLLVKVMFGNNDEDYERFLNERQRIVSDTMRTMTVHYTINQK